jgi:glycosyltransferase involved in cell wall biosynthesis
MTVLNLLVEEMLTPSSLEVGRYTEQLARALILESPKGCSVDGFVAASTEPDYSAVLRALPGLGTLKKSSLARRELTAAWQHGFTRSPERGMLHAPSLLAPLSRHDRLNGGGQTVVTVHDTLAWSNPGVLSARAASWQRAMVRRAERYADAVVVSTHSVGASLVELTELGDRVRVISPAPSPTMVVPADADARAVSLGLPERFVVMRDVPLCDRLAELTLDVAREIDDLAFVVLSAREPDQVAAKVARDQGVTVLWGLTDADIAVVLSRAALYLDASETSERVLALLDALALGIPVVHSDSPSLVEIAAGSTIVLPAGSANPIDEVGAAISEVLRNPDRAQELSRLGRDRARLFSWRSTAEKVWQLHADL